MTKTTFAVWTQAELARRFGLRRRDRLDALDAWLAIPVEVPEFERTVLDRLRERLDHRADSWNEEEMKMGFIGPLVSLVDYDSETTGFFADRPLTATIGDFEIAEVPDGIVARGVFEPEAPYFCLHEYKKEMGTDADPRGQVLSAMLAARRLNAAHGYDGPMYGAYVLGRFWFFLVLAGHDYAVSRDFSATRDTVDIYRVMAALKSIVPS